MDPPRSVTADSIPKPLIELSVLMYESPEQTSMRQFKYVCALVQELLLKVMLLIIKYTKNRFKILFFD